MGKRPVKDIDLSMPGVEIEVSAEEAEMLGAFEENALTEEEAKATWTDEYEDEVQKGE